MTSVSPALIRPQYTHHSDEATGRQGMEVSTETMASAAPMEVDPFGDAPNPDEAETDVEEAEMHDEDGVDRDEGEQQEVQVPPPPRPHAEARVRALPRPVAPTRAEREAHEVCHLPYATWCSHCVAGCAQNDPHRRLKKHDDENVVPVVSVDFAFSKKAEQEGTSPVLVVRDHKTRMTFAHPVPGKSTRNEPYSNYTVDAVVQDLKMLDRKRCILKSDQEPAMEALQERVQRARSGVDEHTVLENSPVDESQSNGTVEKAIKEVENHVRTMTSALETRLGEAVPWDHPLMLWMIEYSATLMNLFRVGKDEQSPMQRLRGVKHGRPLAEYGECVLYKPLGDDIAFPEPRFLQ